MGIFVEETGVRRTHGWATLARIAIEVIGLAFADRMMQDMRNAKRTWSVEFPNVPSEAQATTDAAVLDEKEPEVAIAAANEIETRRTTVGTVPTYLSEVGDDRARYYRSADDATAWIAAAFYDDGRVRIVDGEGNHYAGRVENGRAELASGTDERCELFIDMAADGNVRLSLLGGPHDGRVVRCEAVTA